VACDGRWVALPGMEDPRLYRRVYAALSARITDGTLPSGARLNIGALADEFDVSRDSVQRAIQLLAGEERVERFPGLGWFVK
jgi:DNA-binding GntR family transcriptional regulator